MPEWSKGVDLRPTIFECAGSKKIEYTPLDASYFCMMQIYIVLGRLVRFEEGPVHTEFTEQLGTLDRIV